MTCKQGRQLTKVFDAKRLGTPGTLPAPSPVKLRRKSLQQILMKNDILKGGGGPERPAGEHQWRQVVSEAVESLHAHQLAVLSSLVDQLTDGGGTPGLPLRSPPRDVPGAANERRPQSELPPINFDSNAGHGLPPRRPNVQDGLPPLAQDRQGSPAPEHGPDGPPKI